MIVGEQGSWWDTAPPVVQAVTIASGALVLCVLIVVVAWYWNRGRS